MYERREGRTSVGGPVLLIIAVLLSSAVCRRETGRETQAGDPVPAAALSVPAPPPVDRALDDCFAFAGGLPVESPSYAAWLEDASWKEFAALTGKAWEEFDSAVLQPMKAWAREDLWEINEYPAALFYPFGGPDFATAFALFPGATKTILMGLEP
ncbi:MAG: hypothetical protein MUQ25_18670, partial [Candidatus Aminicenantes bacterium]|nr:hypothetical protein [Candidatus Aminicenantes bacterium]